MSVDSVLVVQRVRINPVFVPLQLAFSVPYYIGDDVMHKCNGLSEILPIFVLDLWKLDFRPGHLV